MHAAAPMPWMKRKTISHSMVGESPAADAADGEHGEAEIERRLPADHVGDRPVGDLRHAEGDEEHHQRHLRGRGRGVEVGGDRRQAGRYMSMANGPTAVIRPSDDGVLEEIGLHGRGLSGSTLAPESIAC